MSCRRFTPAGIDAALAAIERRPREESIVAACRRLKLSRASYYRWKSAGRRRRPSGSSAEHQARLLARKISRQDEEQRILRTLAETMTRVDRQRAAVWVQSRLGVSRKLVKRTLGVDPAARPSKNCNDQAIAARMLDLAREHPGFGYRRLAFLLRTEGVVINHKRAARIWRDLTERLQHLQRRPRRKRAAAKPSPLVAPWPRYCWSLDVTSYRTQDYRRLEFLTILDDFSRLCLALHAARTVKASDMREVLQKIFVSVGPPRHLRVDRQAAELLRPVSPLLDEHFVGVRITRGQTPAENAYIESFHATLVSAFFGIYSFQNVAHAQLLADEWRTYYNERRPHSSLSYQTPRQFLEMSSALLSNE